jgi:hypothetical protein
MERISTDPIPAARPTAAPALPSRPARPRAPAYQGRVYEDDLNADPRWALSEGSRFFEGEGRVQEALAKITRRLNELGIPYCVVGGMALFQHGYRRFTEDVDILVTREGLREIHAKLDGLGYLPPFGRRRNLRDADLGVRIKFLIAGEFPGDDRPKPVAFPDPAAAGVVRDGVAYLNLARLVELKLASGMTNAGRMRDLSDALELMKALALPLEFGDQLNPYVRAKYDELWRLSRKRYVKLAKPADPLDAMLADGVWIDEVKSVRHKTDYLVTADPETARKYDLHDESEFWDADDDPTAPSES